MAGANDVSALDGPLNGPSITSNLVNDVSILNNTENLLSLNGGLSELSTGALFPILNQLSVSPSVAYSLRKLKTTYSGKAVRVRRSSDNTELDIGFTFSGGLDTAALLAFCGAGNGFVTTWYDQSSNEFNAVQATAASQPRIVFAGVVDLSAGLAAQNFFGAQSLSTTSVLLLTDGQWTANVVFSTTTPGVLQCLLDQDNTFRVAQYIRSSVAAAVDSVAFNTAGGVASASSGAPIFGKRRIATAVRTVTTLNDYVDGVGGSTVATTGTPRALATPLTIGTRTSAFLTGLMFEALIFPSALSILDRQTLERNQGAYYGVSVA